MEPTRADWKLVSKHAGQDVRHFYIISRANDDDRLVTLAEIFPVSDDGQEGSESHANALAMAEAKNLLAALDAAVERLEAGVPPKGGATERVLKQCYAAIAKAEGK